MNEALFLSRLQFGWVISFHIIFPALTIGLASWLVFLEAWWLKTRSEPIRDLLFFWMKVFSISFGVGVVSGIVMSFQFGTNWAGFSTAAGNIVGPLLNYEVLTAFFVEASFLGVMLFGWNRVSHKVHFASTIMVALGTLASTFWIMSANSWMQTPAGYTLVDGVFYPESWWDIIFNPSFLYRLPHMVAAAFLSTAFIIGGVSAAYLLRGKFIKQAKFSLKCAIIFVAIMAPLQIVIGDLSGQQVLRDQPAKLAAMEGHWQSDGKQTPLVLFAIPNETAERNDYALEIPHLGSLILTHSWNGTISSLSDFDKSERPPVAIPFYAFRIMVALGVLMLIVAWLGLWRWHRQTLTRSRLYLQSWLWMMPSGFIALLAGWWVAEVGRQPWTVYGLLRTADSASLVPAGSVMASLIIYILVYVSLFGFVSWYLFKMLRTGPVAAPQRKSSSKTHSTFSLVADKGDSHE